MSEAASKTAHQALTQLQDEPPCDGVLVLQARHFQSRVCAALRRSQCPVARVVHALYETPVLRRLTSSPESSPTLLYEDGHATQLGVRQRCTTVFSVKEWQKRMESVFAAGPQATHPQAR